MKALVGTGLRPAPTDGFSRQQEESFCKIRYSYCAIPAGMIIWKNGKSGATPSGILAGDYRPQVDPGPRVAWPEAEFGVTLPPIFREG